MRRKVISKNIRKSIYDKYEGHCAYCGKELSIDAFQVDHMKPVREMNGILDHPENDTIENLVPSCRQCNKRKGSGSIEFFRHELECSLDRLRMYNATFRFAELYEQIEATPKKVVFFFEKFNEQNKYLNNKNNEER